jgi:DNA-binding HxlR family transcriptional regulator
VLGKDYEGQDCALARALEVVGERWTLLIVRDAFYGVRRFGEFAAHLDIPRAVLSNRLRSLVDAGVLIARPDPERPDRPLYELTPAGVDLWPAVHALLKWGERHRSDGRSSRTFVHAACGTELDQGAACPRCGLVPPPTNVVAVLRPGRTVRRDDAVTLALCMPHRLLEPLALAGGARRPTTPGQAVE